MAFGASEGIAVFFEDCRGRLGHSREWSGEDSSQAGIVRRSGQAVALHYQGSIGNCVGGWNEAVRLDEFTFPVVEEAGYCLQVVTEAPEAAEHEEQNELGEHL